MKVHHLFLSALFGFSAILGTSMSAQAEGGCPSGYVPTPNQGQPCAADYNLPYWNQQQQSQPQVQPRVRVVYKWGALAYDKTNGVYGASDNNKNERSAKSKAMKDCQNRGGKNCEILNAYGRDHCIGLARSRTGEIAWKHEVSVKDASEVSIKDCESSYGKGNCQVIYSGCSYAVRVE
ncbi:protein of unknown function [Acinetobacter marinus]|uniref:DUF4189 domain-containing protein n=1 Tax=Acinetobacter marinus TaxID=281375 RepID=A0A1G6IG01_9GAMM|nr:DUF4189 domain-containing protein [Acinetobacter marinus]SDC05449.1 protein of unknown function [Acinetobacter marinus]